MTATLSAAAAGSGHAQHVSTLLLPVLFMASWAVWSDVRALRTRQGDQAAPTTVLVAAVLSAAAGLIHAMVTGPHFAEDVLYGLFFAAATVAQFGWAWLAVRRCSRPLLALGVAGNAAIVVLWAVTRFAGIPLGADAGQREGIGFLDVTSGILEVAICLFCAVTLLRRPTVTARTTPPSPLLRERQPVRTEFPTVVAAHPGRLRPPDPGAPRASRRAERAAARTPRHQH